MATPRWATKIWGTGAQVAPRAGLSPMAHEPLLEMDSCGRGGSTQGGRDVCPPCLGSVPSFLQCQTWDKSPRRLDALTT